ncbi:MAG TPA: glycosyltransferase family 4 protein [Ramlibacter sp.]|uniref:glycosyltransferase family 4 protein n=1 Tax=Ramlibacter sp. TaxID=1917967 RepID=UPI002D810BB0|nr:glycosyltransferase family 4 protein [Ramlibacter sp.]HET8745220.1 glycosyltransferase family 4 protein [Ramlibacter sp.]
MQPAERPPRIALVRGSWNAAGGAERFVQRIAQALASRGVELTMIARKWPRGGEFGLPPNVRCVELGNFHVGRRWRDQAFSRAVREAVAREGFDLVQSHERIPGLPLYRAGDGVHRQWLALRGRKGGWWRRLGDALSAHHRMLLRTEREMFQHPALRCIVCNSEMVRDEIARHYGVAPEKMVVIRNGIDLQRFRPPEPAQRQAARERFGWPEDRTVFLFVGSGFERKGVEGALRAFAAGGLQDRALLVVVGHDKHLARYQKLAERLGVAGSVRFTGAQNDVLPYYHGADAFVLPTLYDPQSNAVLEAMACGLPAITTTSCGVAELLSPASGHVVDAFDVPALARAMADLLPRDHARALGAAARRAMEPYGIDRMTDDYLALYARLLGAPSLR